MTTLRLQVKRPYKELEARCASQQDELDALRTLLRTAERERDEVRQGLEHLTIAFRRRGCCDNHVDSPPSK